MTFRVLLFLLFTNLGFSQTIDTNNKVLIEGFYVYGFEISCFYEIENDNISKPVWLEFDEGLNISEKQKEILKNNNLEGVYIKVYGLKKINGNFGHLGSYNSKIVVSEIVEMNPEITISKFFNK